MGTAIPLDPDLESTGELLLEPLVLLNAANTLLHDGDGVLEVFQGDLVVLALQGVLSSLSKERLDIGTGIAVALVIANDLLHVLRPDAAVGPSGSCRDQRLQNLNTFVNAGKAD